MSEFDQVSSPKEAYDRGTKAWKSGDKRAAAQWFARADAIEPSDRALAAAFRAATAADLPALAMALAERAERSGASKQVTTLAGEARAKHSKSVGRIVVTCAGEPCQPELDGAPPPEGGWLEVGEHVVSWVCPLGEKTQTLSLSSGADLRFDASCPQAEEPKPAPAAVAPAVARQPAEPASPPPGADRSGGLSPTWLWLGVGVTVVLGAATTWSGIDTNTKHDDYVAGGRNDTALRDDGVAAQTRTNVLAAGTAVAGIATVALGLFAVDFGEQRVGIHALPDGARASLRAQF